MLLLSKIRVYVAEIIGENLGAPNNACDRKLYLPYVNHNMAVNLLFSSPPPPLIIEVKFLPNSIKKALVHLYVFRGNGELVFSHHFRESDLDPALAAGFFSAIQDFAKGMLNDDVNLREVRLDKYKITFASDRESDLIAAVVTDLSHGYLAADVAQSVLEQLKSDVQANDFPLSEDLILEMEKPFKIVVELTDRGKILPFKGLEADIVKLCDGTLSVNEIAERLDKPLNEIASFLSKLKREQIVKFSKVIL